MRYLMIPTGGSELPPLPARRAARVEAVLEARRSMPPPPALPAGVRILASPLYETPITRVTVVEAPAGDEAALDEAFPGHERVEDFTLDLIAPVPGEALAGTAGDTPAEADLGHLERIGLLAARRRGFALTGASVTVALLDTGVADVPELAGRIVENRVFDVDTGQYLPAPPADTHNPGHGTHVAGIVAGRHVGVAPGARLVSLTTIPGGSGTLSHWVFALEYAQTRPEIRLLSCSAGKPGQVPQMRYMMQIARRLDILAVMAIGNDGADTSRSPGNYPEVLSVGALDAGSRVWEGSSGGIVDWDGTRHAVPTLVAPGVDVHSCVADGSFRAMTGTSMATPVVTGLAALVIERHPDIGVDALRDEILSACVGLDLDAGRQGAGAAMLPPGLA